MSVTSRSLDRLERDVGAILERNEGGSRDFSVYRDDPLGFARDVLDARPWSKQREALDLLASNRLVRILSAHGCGKTYDAAIAVLWWLYARGPSAVVTLAPTQRQVRELLWGEIRSMFLRTPNLPGDIFAESLRVNDAERHFAIGFSGADAGRVTGFHHPRLLVVVDEAHGLEEWGWEAVFSLVTDPNNSVLAIGNPGPQRAGRWWSICNSSAWAGVHISAQDLIASGEGFPGGASEQFVEDVRREWGGTDSPAYQIRVLGEFPRDSVDALVQRAWLDRAEEIWRAHKDEPITVDTRYRLGVDPARFGPDESVVAIVRGDVLSEFRTWRGKSTTETAARVATIAEDLTAPLPVQPRRVFRMRDDKPLAPRVEEVVVDEAGLGGGVYDELHRQDLRVRQFNGGSSAGGCNGDRYLNQRAEAAWHLRGLLERGEVGLPPDPMLREELLAMTYRFTSSDRIQLQSKDDLKKLIGRSPDRADAAMMAFSPAGHAGPVVWWPGMEEDMATAAAG